MITRKIFLSFFLSITQSIQGAYAGGCAASPILSCRDYLLFLPTSLRTGHLPTQSSSQEKVPTRPSHELCDHSLGRLHPRMFCQVHPDGQGRLPGSTPHAHVARAGLDELCRQKSLIQPLGYSSNEDTVLPVLADYYSLFFISFSFFIFVHAAYATGKL